MDLERPYRLEALWRLHATARFSCGDGDIDSYLRDDALQQMEHGLARTFVEIEAAEPDTTKIAGFFTLRAHSLRIQADYFDYLDDEPEESVIELPIIELMYLARDSRLKGRGMGPTLMIECIRIVDEIADRAGIIGVHLRTTRQGERLYLDFDCKPFTWHPHHDRARYVLPIRDVRVIAASARMINEGNTHN